MVMLGDVLAVVAVLLGIYLTVWALVVGCGLLFEHRAERACAQLEANPGRCIGVGAAVALGGLVAAGVLISIQVPGVKLLGFGVVIGLLAVAAVGAGGLARLVGEKIRRLSPEAPAFSAFARGAAIVVAGSLVPFLGWFGFGPFVLFASIGAGWGALRAERLETAR